MTSTLSPQERYLAARRRARLALVKIRPQLLIQKHVPPIFTGENILHVLIVNGREDFLVEVCTGRM